MIFIFLWEGGIIHSFLQCVIISPLESCSKHIGPLDLGQTYIIKRFMMYQLSLDLVCLRATQNFKLLWSTIYRPPIM